MSGDKGDVSALTISAMAVESGLCVCALIRQALT